MGVLLRNKFLLLYQIKLFILLLLPFIFSVNGSYAVEPNEILPDRNLESRARTLSKELRCLVCRNESIDESNSLIAKDLRILLREMLLDGRSDKEILNYLVDRYGEYILLKPKFDKKNIILWSIGPVIFGLSLIILFLVFSRRNG